jgi:hypothetical protein
MDNVCSPRTNLQARSGDMSREHKKGVASGVLAAAGTCPRLVAVQGFRMESSVPIEGRITPVPLLARGAWRGRRAPHGRTSSLFEPREPKHNEEEKGGRKPFLMVKVSDCATTVTTILAI